MNEYHILWLQTIPSIASIYYYSHLVDTHELYCLDEGQQPQTIRSIARSLHNQVTKVPTLVYLVFFFVFFFIVFGNIKLFFIFRAKRNLLFIAQHVRKRNITV
jgi:hypothetical protein